ncbi:N-formylglutamate amidohydrolase [Stappia sp. GBMRC 2046]|uniref:N-formylglutamate amidohydrolase n=1 Tax=Stappia sediminis TaxID=2692190 RepID=A0A7X3LTB2_9HYPH|nr:N-formylglutamate amidohydrolase [Stappia sediminis]MXN64706.1 N-formylglutamate amidohydrolase [Stappia sediminis]
MSVAKAEADGAAAPVAIVNRAGAGAFVVLCDHASNALPARFGTLGLSPADLQAHIAWDPGALGVSRRLSGLLDAPLVHPTLSRLLVDCNRAPDAPDLAPALSEATEIPGNRDLSEEDRAARIALVHTPFHAAVDEVLDERAARGLPTLLVSVHTFTPVYRGVSRPWQIGVLYDQDRRLAERLISALKSDSSLTVGDNEPYAPSDGVYYTLDRHGQARGLASVMLEIRNDEVADAAGEEAWAHRLAALLAEAGRAVSASEAGRKKTN